MTSGFQRRLRILNTGHDRKPGGTVRVTIPEALTLQGFPADYPLAGTKTSQAHQVGNAVPPPLAAACIEAVT